MPVDIELCKLWESGPVVACTERVNVAERARSLCTKLIARKVKDTESLFLLSLIEFLQCLILWCKSAFCRRIDDEQYLALVVL